MGDIFSGVRKGKIKLNGKKAPHSKRIQVGDEVTLFMDTANLSDAQKKQTTTHKVTKKLEQGRIIYEDGEMIAYDKPAWLVVHQTDHKTDEVSLIEQIHDYLKGVKSESLTFVPALAHRIDRETSGVILIAKTKHALEHLTEQFRKRSLQKEYLTLVHGTPHENEGIIDAPLLRTDEDRKDKPKVTVDTKVWLTAQTSYQVMQTYRVGGVDFSLVRCQPKSGRMHQIRVHMAHIGTPIIGDRRYLTPKLRIQDKILLQSIYQKKAPPRGHLLHAHAITFDHPTKWEMSLTTSWDLIKNIGELTAR